MEGSSPEDLSVGPSVINRSRTIHMEGRTLKRSGSYPFNRPSLSPQRKQGGPSSTEFSSSRGGKGSATTDAMPI